MRITRSSEKRSSGTFFAFLLALCAAAPAAFAHDSDGATAANKKLVSDFFTLLFVEKRAKEAFDKYVSNDYIQHNPMAPDGAAPAVKFLSEWFIKNPNAVVDIKRIIADGDLVAVHHHMRSSPDDRGIVVVDIFRVESGKVVEHWDVVQPMPEKSANPHPMF